jgi:hypothetical protein
MSEKVAMPVTWHSSRTVFQRHSVQRDEVQADALAQEKRCLVAKRGTSRIEGGPGPRERSNANRTDVFRSPPRLRRRIAGDCDVR